MGYNDATVGQLLEREIPPVAMPFQSSSAKTAK